MDTRNEIRQQPGMRKGVLSRKMEEVATKIVDSAFKVHLTLGPGLMENVYEVCLEHELQKRDVSVKRQVEMPIKYGNITLDAGLRMDMVVNDLAVVELKAVEQLLPVHSAQLLTYMKLSGMKLGFLINFNVPLIKGGIKRMIL